MADNNLLKRSGPQQFDDNDPFAELTRIMARDHRSEVQEPGSDDSFGIDLEKELLGEFEDPFDDAAGSSGPRAAAHQAVEQATQAVAPAEGPEDELAGDAFDDAFVEDFDNAYREEPRAEPMRAETLRQAPADGDLGLADVDMDFGDLDFSEQEDAEFDEAADAESTAQEAAESMQEVESKVSELEPAERGAPSLEDELAMLLSEGGAPVAEELNEAAADEGWLNEEGAAESATEAVPHLPLYGRANFPPPRFQREAEIADDRWADEPDWGEPTERIADPAQDEFQAAPSALEEDTDWMLQAEAEPEPRIDAEPAPEPQEATDPFAVFSTLAPAASTPSPTRAAPLPFDAASELETVEVPEAAVPLQDDLDLPEPEGGDEPAETYDEYEAEFAHAFGEMGDSVATMADAERLAAKEDEDRFFADAFVQDGTPAEAEATRYTAPAWDDAGPAFAGNEAVDELEREIDVAAFGTAAPVARRRNGIFVAGAVVAIAALGGIGAFALSFGDGSDDSGPVLVEADAGPLKVKPENPGGATVPNQDSEAYARVSGSSGDTPPAQERLVTTSEEPVDLAARAEGGNTLPGVDEALPAVADGSVLADSEDLPGGKSEERIAAPEQEAEGVGVAEDLAAVQPRRVRTMIVRPDGTLVPREDPAPEPSAAAAADGAPATGPVASQEGPAQTQQPAAVAVAVPAAEAIRKVAIQQAALDADEQPAAREQNQPNEVAAPPARAATPSAGPLVQARPVDQPVQGRQPAQEQVAQAAAPARSQPAAPQPATSGGEWSMQIASQPTADAAQATYQDLARRYGGIIGGHGVNIVRAEIPGKGTYFRVRIPSSSRGEAISLCERYKAAGGSCFVSK